MTAYMVSAMNYGRFANVSFCQLSVGQRPGSIRQRVVLPTVSSYNFYNFGNPSGKQHLEFVFRYELQIYTS